MDDLLITIIIAGIGLSIAYLRAELLLHRGLKATARRKELALREVHINRVRPEQKHMSRQPGNAPSPIQANGFHVMRGLARALRIFIQENTYSI